MIPVLSARLRGTEEIGEVLLCILFAGLGRFSNFLANSLPLIILVVFDGTEQSLALILSELGIVHVLVPVLLDAAFSTSRECLSNLCPTVSRVPHLFQS